MPNFQGAITGVAQGFTSGLTNAIGLYNQLQQQKVQQASMTEKALTPRIIGAGMSGDGAGAANLYNQLQDTYGGIGIPMDKVDPASYGAPNDTEVLKGTTDYVSKQRNDGNEYPGTPSSLTDMVKGTMTKGRQNDLSDKILYRMGKGNTTGKASDLGGEVVTDMYGPRGNVLSENRQAKSVSPDQRLKSATDVYEAGLKDDQAKQKDKFARDKMGLDKWKAEQKVKIDTYKAQWYAKNITNNIDKTKSNNTIGIMAKMSIARGNARTRYIQEGMKSLEANWSFNNPDTPLTDEIRSQRQSDLQDNFDNEMWPASEVQNVLNMAGGNGGAPAPGAPAPPAGTPEPSPYPARQDYETSAPQGEVDVKVADKLSATGSDVEQATIIEDEKAKKVELLVRSGVPRHEAERQGESYAQKLQQVVLKRLAKQQLSGKPAKGHAIAADLLKKGKARKAMAHPTPQPGSPPPPAPGPRKPPAPAEKRSVLGLLGIKGEMR